MSQLGKYSSDRDCILHYMATSDWSNDSFGDVEAPTGYVWRISNTRADIFGCFDQGNMEFDSLIEDELKTYEIEDTPEFRKSLVGNFLVTENSQGFVSVYEFETENHVIAEFRTLQGEYDAWASEDAEEV